MSFSEFKNKYIAAFNIIKYYTVVCPILCAIEFEIRFDEAISISQSNMASFIAIS